MRRGFTLLEMIVAAALILALVVAMGVFLTDALRIRSRVSEEMERSRTAAAVVSAIERAIETTLVDDPTHGPGVVGDATSISVLSAGLSTWRLGTTDRALALEEVDRLTVEFDESGRRLMVGRGGEPLTPLPGRIERVRFRYYDGSRWRQTFDSVALGQLPSAVEIALWLRPRMLAEQPVERPEFDVPESADAEDAGPPPDRLRVVSIPDAAPEAGVHGSIGAEP
jgi:prepilin-type N-terminal cleavage/methylation domain-containing protein